MVTRVISDLGQIATSLMLVVLGGQFKFQKVTANRKPLVFTTLSKLVVVPGVMIAAAVLAGYRGAQLAPVFGVFATPTAIASLVMANSMGGDGDLAGDHFGDDPVFGGHYRGVCVRAAGVGVCVGEGCHVGGNS